MPYADLSGPDQLFPVFVFPLNEVVFYPATSKPLNIFEPCYIQMMSDAIEQNEMVALAYSDASSPSTHSMLNIRRTAGTGRPVLLERRVDGTLLILIDGLGKVYLQEELPTADPYMTCLARWVDENTELQDENRFLLNRLTKDLGSWLGQHLEDINQANKFLQRISTPQEKINYLCSFMIRDPEAKQQLLETDNINDRIRVASILLATQETL